MSGQVYAVCLMGPTASGKSDLAIELATRFPFEIVSVDSALVYRSMDIGTAKPSLTLRAEVPHHLIDIRDPADPYSAAAFRDDAERVMAEIHARGRVPLLTGGTMLYFKALIEGIAELPEADPEVRASITRLAEQQGWPAIHARLAEVDPVAAARIRPNDPQRLQRALEVYEISGRSLTSFHDAGQRAFPHPMLQVAIVPPDRSALHKRIETRFHRMLEDGLLEEVAALRDRGDLAPDLPAIRSVGYRQVWAHLAGELSHDEMVYKGIVATRQLAKRQYTWLRGWRELQVLPTADLSAALKILDMDIILG